MTLETCEMRSVNHPPNGEPTPQATSQNSANASRNNLGATSPQKSIDSDESLWVIHGRRYDLTSFVSRHPGGTHAILLGRGGDCTALFESYHILTTAHRDVLKQYDCHSSDCIPDSVLDWDHTPFYDFLHSGSHFALSKKPWVNILFARLGFLHDNLHLWLLQHSKSHHCYTNVPKLDPDLNHFLHGKDDAPGFRLHPEQAYLKKYVWWKLAVLYQSTATTMALSFMLLPQFILDGKISQVSPIPSELIPGILLERSVLGVLVLGALYHFTLFKGIWFILFPWAVHGMLFYVFSQISHCNAESMIPTLRGGSEKMEWAKWQVLTALDYAPESAFWNLWSVGLNNQILHHLFPGVHPCHYPELRQVLLPVAARHGIPYAERSQNTFWGMLRKYWHWLATINDSEDGYKASKVFQQQ